MAPIPISAAKMIADSYGYDQVVIIARRVGSEPAPHGEHCTAYGATTAHCAVAARMGDVLKHKVMGWPEVIGEADLDRLARIVEDTFLVAVPDDPNDPVFRRSVRQLAERLGIVTLPDRSTS